MKKLLLLYVLCFILSAGFAQTVRRVNNNPGVTGTNVFSTFAAAHTAAVANDIILIEPSTISYGDIILTKPLKIYGNGYYLDTNSELKIDKRNSILNTIEFNTGSGGSEIYGINGQTFLIYGVSNIKISRCIFNSSITIINHNKANTTNTNVSNILITQNIGYHVNTSPTASFTISNVLVNNNLFNRIDAGSTLGIINWVVINNTFINYQTSSSSISLVNSVFENNLLMATSGNSVGFTNVTFSFNISTSASFANELNSNKNNYSLLNLDTGESQLVGTGTGISPDEQFQIKPGAELKTLGNGGSEVGAFGGDTPYIISGIPPIPSIVEFFNTGTGDTNNPLKVNISVKSNN